MQFHQVPGTNVRLSRAALGGHEYLPNGNSRGFNEDFAKAITPGHSTTAISVKPAYPEAHSSRGRAYFDVGAFEKALSDLNEAIRWRPRYPVALAVRGLTLEKVGDVARAKADYEAVLKIGLSLAPVSTAATSRGTAWPSCAPFCLSPTRSVWRRRLPNSRLMPSTKRHPDRFSSSLPLKLELTARR